MVSKKNILGVDITDASKAEVLEYIIKNLEKKGKKQYFVTPNPEFLVLANKDKTFRTILNQADLALADGIGVLIAGNLLGKGLKSRFTGVDLVKSVCEKVAEKPITVGFLGGGPHIAEQTAECLLKNYPGLKIAFVGEEWEGESSIRSLDASLEPSGNTSIKSENISSSPDDSFCKNISGDLLKSSSREGSRFQKNNSAMKQFNQKTIDILFVAFGAPKQEYWISKNLDKIPVKIAVGVGGAFDYISGKVPRAPGFVRTIGLEWLFRLVVQPWRLKRQLSLMEFAYLVLKEKLKK